jgi:transposase
MKAYSVDFREKIVSAIEKGDSSVRKVAQRFGVSKNCVQKLVTQKRTKGHILPGKQGGSMVSPVMKYKAQLIAIPHLSLWEIFTKARHFSRRKIKVLTQFDRRELFLRNAMTQL